MLQEHNWWSSFLAFVFVMLPIAGFVDGCAGCSDKYQDRWGDGVPYRGRIEVTRTYPATDQGFIGNRLTYDGEWQHQQIIEYREITPFAINWLASDLWFGDRDSLQGVEITLSYDTSQFSLRAGDTLDATIVPATTFIPFAAWLSSGNSRRGFYLDRVANLDSVYTTGERSDTPRPSHSIGDFLGWGLGAVALGLGLFLGFRGAATGIRTRFRKKSGDLRSNSIE